MRSRRVLWCWMLVGGVCAAMAACRMHADDDDDDEHESVGPEGGRIICDPGATQRCFGPGACEGAQVCEMHGMSWGPCNCGSGAAGSAGAGEEPHELLAPGAGGQPGSSQGAAGEAGSGEAGAGQAGGAGGDQPTPTCDDGTVNGDESDIDCGGSTCPSCPPMSTCESGADCDSGVCFNNRCRHPACDDSVLNGDETDVDCGGPGCSPCLVGQACVIRDDCESRVCRAGACQEAACNDQVLNGDETDVDCGGACPPCADGQGCISGADCSSGFCTDNVCVAS